MLHFREKICEDFFGKRAGLLCMRKLGENRGTLMFEISMNKRKALLH